MKRSSISINRWLLLSLLVCLGSSTAGLAAQVAVKPVPKVEGKLDAQAEELYRKGVAQYKAEQYADAVVSFEAAYRISGAPRLLYNLGTAHRKLGHLQDAIDFFDEYLKREPTIEPERRTTVEGYITELRAELHAKAVAAAPSPTPQPVVTEPPKKTPLYRKWWFWTAVGGAVVITGLSIGLAVGLQPRQTLLNNYYDPTF